MDLVLLKYVSGDGLDYSDSCQSPDSDSYSVDDKNTVNLHAKSKSQELI